MKKSLLTTIILLTSGHTFAGIVQDKHGNVGYDTAAECDAAVNAGVARFYQSFTHKPPMLRAGEARVKSMPMHAVQMGDQIANQNNFGASNYAKGACDLGAPHKAKRDGVSKELQGKYIPYSPNMLVNVYYNKAGEPVRLMMKQCDNWFGGNWPRPLPVVAPVRPATPTAAVAPRAIAPAPAPVIAPPVVVAPAPVLPVNPPIVSMPAALPVPAAQGAAVATSAASGGVGVLGTLGIAAAIAVPLVILSRGDSTSGTTGTR